MFAYAADISALLLTARVKLQRLALNCQFYAAKFSKRLSRMVKGLITRLGTAQAWRSHVLNFHKCPTKLTSTVLKHGRRTAKHSSLYFTIARNKMATLILALLLMLLLGRR